MAVEKITRKRKHKIVENVADEDEAAVPKKKIKKRVSNEEQNQEEELNLQQNDVSLDVNQSKSKKNGHIENGFEIAENEIKFPNDFKMLDFRNKLRGTNFITELRHFLYMTKIRPNMIIKYIEKRGKPLELAEAFMRIDKTNVLHIAYLSEALEMVVMNIVSENKSLMESAEYACRYFLKNHANLLESLLQSAQYKHRRIALKLLTAIVCVEPQLGRQILSSYDILSDVTKMRLLLSHSKEEIDEEDSVRKCFIHFVLSYMIDGNILLIRNILDRSAVIHALISDLMYDDYVTVCMVLSTLQKYVLESADISKTKKLNIFDLESCRNLASLYDWEGPKIFAVSNPTNLSEVKNAINLNDLEQVRKSVHEFLIILLTSRKYGITFDSTLHFKQKYNVLQGKFLAVFYKPWADDFKTELVMKILIACPEISRVTVRHFSGCINPARYGFSSIVKAIEFLTKLITTAHPKFLGKAIDNITITDFGFLIKAVCLPIESLALIEGSKLLQHFEFSIRFHTVRLLYAMFSQYVNYMNILRKRENQKNVKNSLRHIKFDLLNHIFTNFPTIENILHSLFISIRTELLATDEILQHLDVTLDTVLIIAKENRSFVNKTATILDYIDILRPIYANDDYNGDINNKNIWIEMKAIRTILLFNPKALEPSQQLFGTVLKSFIKAFVFGPIEIQTEAGELLRKIFRNTNLFTAGELEIDLWLEALRFFDMETVDLVTQVFTEVFQVCGAEVEMPSTIETISNIENLHKLFENIEKGLSVEAYVETLLISKLMPLIFKGVEICKYLEKYLSVVCLLMFYYYPTPEYVLKLYEMKFVKFIPYMQSWLLKENQPQLLESKLLKKVPYLYEIHASIINGSGKFIDIFAKTNDNEAIEYELYGKTYQLVPILKKRYLITIYVESIIFLITQLIKHEKLQRNQAECAAELLSGCLNIIAKSETANQIIITDNDNDDDDASTILLSKLLKYIYGIRLVNIQSSQLFDVSNGLQDNFTYFLRLLTQNCNQLDNFDHYAINYRLKVVKAVAISLQNIEQTKNSSDKLNESIQLLQVLNLTSENCIEILELLANKLKYNDFFNAETQQKTIYYDLLVAILKRLATLQIAIKSDLFIQKFNKFYINFIKKLDVNINLEALEEAFYNFLIISHQYILQLDRKFFAAMFAERKLNKYTIKLACLLLERNDNLHNEFIKQLPQHLNEKRELIYPLLCVMFDKKYEFDATLLQNCYQTFKNGFMKTIEKPQKAGIIYKENASVSIALIDGCMPKSECIDFCNKNLKFDTIEIYQMHALHAIYKRALIAAKETTNTTQIATIFVNFINLQIQMMSVDLKRKNNDIDKLELFAYNLYDWWQTIDGIENIKPDFTKVLSSQQWVNFAKSCLKAGMQIKETATDDELNELDNYNGLLLKLLAYLCNNLYIDNCEDFNEPAQLYELMWTHSKFYEIVLKTENNKVKTYILQLLYTLAKKNPTILNNEQVPVYLGAYQARITDADRYTLALLYLFELYDSDLNKYRPFIWGESAIGFYSLRLNEEERSKLTQQETSIAQVMSLIDKQRCEYTLENFPIWRKLHHMQQMPSIEFINPAKKHLLYGTNRLEQRITSGCTNLNEMELRLCPKRDAIYEQCYDPAFIIPLMCLCFSPEVYGHPARPVQNGLLSLGFAALSSLDKDMRLAAGCAQIRYRANFEQNKFFEKPLWIQAYDNIQAGLHDLRETGMKYKTKNSIPRVPYIAGLFVCRTLNMTTDPTNILYKQLTMYLRLKSSFNFLCIPEFNVLFYSDEVEHQLFRQFIIEVIRDGIKCSQDLFLLSTTNTFKVLMSFYGSTMSTLESNLLILSLFSTCVKIPASAKILFENVGIISWLSSIISNIEFYQFDIIEGLITILNNLWYSLQASAAEFHNFAYLGSEMHRLVLSLLPHISARISISNFAKLMHLLQRTSYGQFKAMSAIQLDHLIDCAQKHYPNYVRSIVGIRLFGADGVASNDSFCYDLYRQLLLTTFVDENDVSNTIVALSNLRAYIIDWSRCHSNDVSKANVLNDTIISID